MPKRTSVAGKALFMANISTMKHIKTANQTPVQPITGLDAGNIYRTGPSNERPAGSISNCSLDLEDNADFVLSTIGRVMT